MALASRTLSVGSVHRQQVSRPCLPVAPRLSSRQRHIPALLGIWSQRQPPSRARAVVTRATVEGAIPEGVEIELRPASEGEEVEWDPENKVLRLPISVVEASGERRTKLVIFTCNKCGGRTARNVNPVAWEKGLVMGQCATCQVWHVLSAKNKHIFEEIRYKQPEQNSSQSAESSSSDISSGTHGGLESQGSSESVAVESNSSSRSSSSGSAGTSAE